MELIKIKMNDFSALDTRVSADKGEQVLLIFIMLQIHIQTVIYANFNLCKLGWILYRLPNEFYCYLDVCFHTIDYLFERDQLYY